MPTGVAARKSGSFVQGLILVPLEKTKFFEWFFVILGGIPLIMPFVLYMGESTLGGGSSISWYYWVNAVISGPHVYSTYCRLGRKIGERKVHWFFGFPAYFGCSLFLLYSQRHGFFLEAMTFVNVWQSVHYVRQTFGVYRYLGRDARETVQDRRIAYWAFHLAMPLLVLGRWDTLYTVWAGRSYGFIPMQMPVWVMNACWAGLVVAAILAVMVELRKWQRQKKSYRFEGLAIIAVFFFIHMYGFLSITHFQRGFTAVTIFHAVQYLGLIWWLERESAVSRFKKWPFFVFWGVLFTLGMIWEKGIGYFPSVAGAFLGGISMHHYLVDTVLWRRSVGR